MRRFITLTLLTAAGLVSAAASCGPVRPTPDPVITSAAVPVSEAVQTVRSAAAMLATTAVHFVLTVDRAAVALEGDVDPVADLAQVTGRGIASSRRLGGDLYVKPPNSAGWIHLEIARMQAASVNLAVQRFATQAAILRGLSAATETSPGHFDCRSDLDRAAAEASGVDAGIVQALIVSAHLRGNEALPFQVTVDPEGRLTSIFYVLGAAGATTAQTLTLSKHGQPVPVERPPAAEVTEASPAQYGSL
jgi:hypothetical protein